MHLILFVPKNFNKVFHAAQNKMSQDVMLFFFVDATIYVGGLDEKVSDPTLWELFLQAGPVGKSKILCYSNSILEDFLTFNITFSF